MDAAEIIVEKGGKAISENTINAACYNNDVNNYAGESKLSIGSVNTLTIVYRGFPSSDEEGIPTFTKH